MRTPYSGLVRGTACCLLAAFLACDSRGPDAQESLLIVLDEAVPLAGEFTSVVGVRELADGSVWIADDRELTLTRTSSDRGQLTTIRNVGEGPLEYEDLEAVFPAGPDTTAVWTGKQLLFLSDSSIVGAASSAFGDLAPSGDVRGIDPSGGVLLSVSGSTRPSAGARDGSRYYSVLYRSDRDLSQRDSVTVLQGGTTVVEQPEPGGPIMLSVSRDSEREGAAYLTDGAIAVVRARPYRVEWFFPNGTSTASDTLPTPETFERPVVWLDFEDPVPAPDGSVGIPLVPAPELADSTRYDVISPGGRRGFFVLPPDQEVIGSGGSSLYIVSTSDLGLQTVSRVAWPPSR